MSFNSGNLIRSVNDPKRNIPKNHNHNLSPNVRPIYNPARPIKNNLFPKNHIIINNNNYNIKVNVINKKKEKEKIIEGDLNFNDTSKQQKVSNIQKPNFLNNKPKNPRGMPRKSPLPIPRAYKPKGILNFNRIFTSKQRPSTKQYNKPVNFYKPQGMTSKNNNMLIGINNNTSKTFKSLNIKNDRSHSPLLRTGQNKLMNLGIKPNKNRYISKSPILGKSSAFNRNGGNFGVSLLNSGNNQVKKLPKKTPPKVNTNIHKKIKVNNIIPSQKRNTVISGEIYQDSSKVNNKINYSANNPQNNANINIVKPVSNNNIIVKRNNNNDNLIKISNENEIKSNGMSKKSLNNNKNSEKQNIQGNEENDKEINKEINNIENKEKINTKPIYNKNENEENHKKSSDIKNDLENNIEKEKENLNKNENNNEILKNNELNREKELKNRNNKRSQSQGPVDPFKRDGNSEVKELEEKKDIAATPNKVMKKIKDILPYTHVGFDGEEPKENNQDNYFIFRNFADHKDYIYMSVCDGHGIEGHFVSEFIKEVLPYYMSENLKDKNILKETKIVHQIITETFLIVNNMLVENENINSLFSGSTCISVIFTPERLIVPNIGDSRAVLGRYDKTTGKYKAIELSRDHKPTEKDEAKRIYDNDGRIQPFTEDGEFVGPQRVWVKEEEVPGLAMTRSFGDRVAATVGVMSEPEIKEFNFEDDDKYMIIASDGIREFISSQECIDIFQSYYESNDLKGCCEYLYQESSKRWLKEEEVIDDTTLILVFFE